tara:strand:+ start:239 stop:436 length:198 start_codon:yes stop_codon:yes gene_type:complete
MKRLNNSEACANISYLLWGGLAALRWSRNKLRKLAKLQLKIIVVDDDFTINYDGLAYSSVKKKKS